MIFSVLNCLKLFVVVLCSDKDRELGDAYTEIKALKYHQHLKEKAVEEVLLLVSFS